MEEDSSNIPPPPAPAETIRAEQYNMRNPSVKRILAEARELGTSNEEFSAQPLEENIFEWHFTFRGAPDTDFEVGIYHGRIILPADYPMNPPAFIMLTPNGRFEVGKKICLSISSYHPETWRPCWSIRTAVAALVAFMNTSSPGAIGSIECTPEQRKAFARKSLAFECQQCGPCAELITYSRKASVETPTPSNAQRVFRIPHGTDKLADPVTTPETIVAVAGLHDDRVFIPFDELGDIGDNIDQQIVANWNAERALEAANRNAQAEIDAGNSPTFGVTVGVIVVAIAGIVLRRLITDVSWTDMFGLD